MNDNKLRKALDEQDAYDQAREDTVWAMAGQFYSRRMRSFAVLIWIVSLLFIALAVFAAVAFFQTEQIRYQIMHAAIFVCAVQVVNLMKIFAWQLIHRNRVVRQLKRIEARLAAQADGGQG